MGNSRHPTRRARRRIGHLIPILLLVAAGATPARGEDPPSGAVPFPVDRTTIVRREDGPTYYIDGPTVIPRHAEITVQLGVRIVGINGASLDVQGGLKVHGTQDVWVSIRNVDFSVTRAPRRGLHLDMADLSNCRFVHGEDQGFSGEFTLENSCLQRSCKFDFRLLDGFLKIMTVEFGNPCRITCARQRENPKPVEVEVRSSWMKAIELNGPSHANFRHSEIRGGLVCRDTLKVTVDGCDISTALTFHQGLKCTFKNVKLTKCNLFDGCVLTLDRVCGPRSKKERVKVDKFFFGAKEGGPGILDPKALQALISDGEDDPARKVRAWVPKASKRRHKLVNYDTLRQRAPPLR